MKFERTEVWGFEHALRGMRNPKNSWDKSDSEFNVTLYWDEDNTDEFETIEAVIGDNDMKLAQSLIRAGSEHRKFMRQIFVSVDITAPLYWWKEFDTYKVGTVANSTSTMHKLTSQPITLDCFEIDDFNGVICNDDKSIFEVESLWHEMIKTLELLRQTYLETNDKRIWKELIRLLPESWLQLRTITMTYENIYNICRQRQNHKLNEWSGIDDNTKQNFISWAETLPHADEFIFIEKKLKKENK